jgi:fructan beta-fructosidase
VSLYDEPYRPQIHFTPERNWMNDPNGPIFLDGEYHLFYQYNPEGITWGSICWAHAKSRDLLHWQPLPLALRPHPELGLPFSGSVVLDRENSSGLFEDGGGLVALFTNVAEQELTEQSQSVAYSRDGGMSWELYQGNPVIANTGRGNFRDPKVLRHRQSESWILVVAQEDEVLFYRSPDLLSWTYAGAFGGASGSHAGIWECPDLFELPLDDGESRWVLVVGDGDQAKRDAGGTQYFVGEFDGWSFRSENPPERVLWADSGRDFYAAQSWSGLPPEQGRRVWIAWMSQWIYGRLIPTDPWRGTMCLPRELSLRRVPEGIRLAQQPVRELATLRAGRIEPLRGEWGSYDLESAPEASGAVEVLGTVESSGELRFDYAGEGALVIRLDPAHKILEVDRSSVDGRGFSPHFGGTSRISLAECPGEQLPFRLILDRSTVELFVAHGLVSSTDLIFPPGPLERLHLSGAGVRDVDVFALRSVWF